jgi:bacterioferritin-associated ferredoxin
MFVCNCNGLRERDVSAVIDTGVRTPARVHRACGVQTQCGRCLKDIAGMIRARKAAERTAAQ